MLQALFQHFGTYRQGYFPTLTQRDHAVAFQLFEQLGYTAGINTITAQACRNAHLLEEIAREGDGLLDSLLPRASAKVPNSLGVLQQFLRLFLAAHTEHGGQDHGQGLRMVEAMHSGELMADHVR